MVYDFETDNIEPWRAILFTSTLTLFTIHTHTYTCMNVHVHFSCMYIYIVHVSMKCNSHSLVVESVSLVSVEDEELVSAV